MHSIMKTPLYNQVAAIIVDDILSHTEMKTLPSEEQLSKTINVSKATIREALAELSTQGIIYKAHGIGNVIQRSALNLKFRIDSQYDFVDIIKQAGHKPTMIYTKPNIIEVSETIDNIPKGRYVYYEEGVKVEKGIAYKSLIYIPEQAGSVLGTNKSNLFDFIISYTNERIFHSEVVFIPEIADESMLKTFKLKGPQAIIKGEEVFHGKYDLPLCYSKIFFNPTIFKPAMVRKGFSLDQSREMRTNIAYELVKGI